MIVKEPTLDPLSNVLPRVLSGQVWSNKLLNRTPLASSSTISFPFTPESSGTQMALTGEVKFLLTSTPPRGKTSPPYIICNKQHAL